MSWKIIGCDWVILESISDKKPYRRKGIGLMDLGFVWE